MIDNISPVEIAESTYWVGKREEDSIFHANPYLRVFEGEDASSGQHRRFNFLIDPGSSSDFAIVSQKVSQVIGGLKNVSAIYLNHQDPDVGSITPLITARFARKASIVCSEDTFRLAVHQGLMKDRFIPTERARSGMIALPTGHRVQVVPSPYCHFRGAVMLYDPTTRVLFTGDLFGGLTEKGPGRLDAIEDDWRGIRAFHQIYMPSNLALRRTIDAIRKLDPFPEVLAPQHGVIARGDLVKEWLDRMYHLPVGLDIIDENDESTLDGWNHVLDRVLAVAKSLLGGTAETRLIDDWRLEEHLSFETGKPTITNLGRHAVEKVVKALTHGEPQAIADLVKMEAIAAADQLDLPAPHIPIENMGDTLGDFDDDQPSLT